jgi:sec-independent protein translocase protein TatB
MFDIGWGELLVIGIVALIAIGPKELPTVLRSLGQWMGKIKRMANEFQGQFQEALREAEVADLKKQAEELGSSLTDATNYDPLADIDNDGIYGASEPDKSEPSKTETVAGEHEPAASGEAAVSAEPAAAEPAGELASAEGEAELPPIDVPLPEAPEPVTEKDFAPAEPPPPQQAGGKA